MNSVRDYFELKNKYDREREEEKEEEEPPRNNRLDESMLGDVYSRDRREQLLG
jgi:hypothetical protein